MKYVTHHLLYNKGNRPAGWVWLAGLLLLLVVGCGDNARTTVPTPFPTVTTAPTRTPSPTPAPTGTPAGITTHTIPQGPFTVRLPGDWAVVYAGLTPLGHYYQVGPEPVGPGPFSSSIFVAEGNALGPVAAAEQLLCGGGCAAAVDFDGATVAGEPALSAVLQAEEMPPLTWYFVERADQLIILSLHDPDTLADRPDLLETIVFDLATPTPAATTAPTATLTPTPLPTLEPVRTWRRIAPPDAGLSFEVPAGWPENQEQLFWSPITELDLGIGFNWQAVEDPPLDNEQLLPPEAEILGSAPLELPWTTAAVSYTLALVEDRPATYVVVPAGERAFVFSATAPEVNGLAELQPVLTHMLESVRLDFIIEPVIAEPADAAIGFFQAVINNESEEALLAFLTPRLREEVPEGESPAGLLQLPDRLIEYNLDWEFITDTSVLVTVEITLDNGETVNRALTVDYLGDIGWRIDTIAEVGPAAAP